MSNVNTSPDNTDSSFRGNNDLQEGEIVAIRLEWVTKISAALLVIFQFDKWNS